MEFYNENVNPLGNLIAYPTVSLDITRGVISMKWNYEDFTNRSDCASIDRPKNLGYFGTYNRDFTFEVKFDKRFFSTALAVNFGYLQIDGNHSYLYEVAVNKGLSNIEFPEYILNAFVASRYPDMDLVTCLLIPEPGLMSHSFCWITLTYVFDITTLEDTLPILGLPVINQWDEACLFNKSFKL